MPSPFKQEGRRLQLQTPLGPDNLLARSIRGHEAISALYLYEVEAFAVVNEDIDFSRLIGQPVLVAVSLDSGANRLIHGIVRQVSRGGSGKVFTDYRLEIVPALWLLTRRSQSRIFQQKHIPDILKTVLAGIDFTNELQGTFEPREYCVQYRETDFAFFSRLCEEEGISYYFRHTDNGHQLVLANTPQSHKELPDSPTIHYDPEQGGHHNHEAIHYWEKTQSLRSLKVTLRDHHFQLPFDTLEAVKTVQPTVSVGTVTHKLTAGNTDLELYDSPGGYAGRFDGISPSAGEQASRLQKLYEDNVRTAGIRIEQESVNALFIESRTNYPNILPGYKFTLERHPSDNGTFVVTDALLDVAQEGSYIGGEAPTEEFRCSISFRCIPLALPYRPAQVTPKPVVPGSQTAVVVGPSGEEIFTDKYGRVKVAFYWDRDGKADSDSSCWLRVAQAIAGKQWGTFQLPRIGQEVIVSFLEGDPDRPLITGSVYNAECMPPYPLPDNKTISTWKSNSSTGGGGFNEIRFQDKKGEEQLFMHASRNLDLRTVKDYLEFIGENKHQIVTKDHFERVDSNRHTEIKADLAEKIGGSASLNIAQDQDVKVGMKHAVDAGQEIHLKGGMKVIVEAGTQLSLKVGGNFIDINPGGIFIKGTMVMINSGGSAGSGSGASPDAPQAVTEAAKADPGLKAKLYSTTPRQPVADFGPFALAMTQAANNGTPFCEMCQNRR